MGLGLTNNGTSGGGGGSFTAGGDLSGSSTNQTVVGLDTTALSISGLTSGNVLTFNGTNWINGKVNLASSNAVTGLLPVANQVSQNLTISGDATGTGTTASTSITVTKLNGHGFTPMADGYLYFDGANLSWQTVSGGFTAGGDLSGTSTSQTVIGLDTTPISITSLTSGNVLTYNGTDWVNGQVNLASANAVTGTLPTANQASQSLTLTGDATGTGTTASTTTTVGKINGASVPAAGTLTTGNVLQVSGTSALTYAAVNLAGGSNYVTGTLPAANQANQTLAGDVTGNTGASTVAKVNGATVPAAGTLTTGNVLQVSGTSALSYGALNLAGGANYVTGTLPAANQASQTMAGDVTGTTAASTVAKINGATVPAAGSLTTGNVLQVNGTSSTTYGALNLAGGANYVTGTLPAANQASQTLGGDLSGTTASGTVVKIQGNPVSATAATAGQFLVENSGATGSAWTSISGDVSASTSTVGQLTVTGIDGHSITPLADGYLYYDGTNMSWQPVSGGGGGSVTWANDLVNSTSTNQYVSSLSYSSASTGGTIAINGTATALQVAANNTAFSLSQATQTSDIATNNITIQPQAPYASASTNKVSGDIVLNFPSPSTGLAGDQTAGQSLLFESNGTIVGGMRYGKSKISSLSNSFILHLDGNVVNNSGYSYISAAAGQPTIYSTTITHDFHANSSSYTSMSITSTNINSYNTLQLFQSTSGYLGMNLNSGVGIAFANILTKTANYTLRYGFSATDYIVLVDTVTAAASTTMTLPASPVSGLTYIIKDSTGSANTYNIVVAGNGKNIDGSSSQTISASYGSVEVVYNGTSWNILRGYNTTIL